jgi:hypothetical protein
MTISIHLPAQPDVAVACDMSTAADTPDERLQAYARLFEHGLVRRERRENDVVFVFRAGDGTRKTVEDLARREAACCPFLDLRVETVGDEVVWTVANVVTGAERAAVDATLDAFHALPDHAGSDFAGFVGRLADRDVDVVATDDGRFEWGGSSAGRGRSA